MHIVDRLNGQNYADNIIDPLLANDEQNGWSVSGSGSADMSTNFVFQGKKSLKIQNNAPTANIVASNSIQSSVISTNGKYGLSLYLLKNQPGQALSGKIAFYQNATLYVTQDFVLDRDSNNTDLDNVWVRFDTNVDLEFFKNDVITLTVQLDGIPGTPLVSTAIYVDGLMLYAKERRNAMSPIFSLPIGSRISNYIVNVADDYVSKPFDVVVADASTDPVTVYLPKAVTSLNKKITVKKIDNVNNVTVDGNGSETIDGSTTFIMDTQYQSQTFISDGSTWYKI